MNNPGMRVKKNFLRPDAGLVAALRAVPTANIGDNMNRVQCMNAHIRAMNGSPLAGPAFTVRVRAGDNLMLHKAMDMAKPGDVLVVEAQGGMSYAITGYLMISWCRARGLAGMVIDGCVRDIADIARVTDFAVYAVGVTPNGPIKEGGGEINFPVTCGGLVVNPGDVVIGDADGVVVVPLGAAADVLEKARMQNAREELDKASIANLAWDRSWVDKVLAAKGCEFVD